MHLNLLLGVEHEQKEMMVNLAVALLSGVKHVAVSIGGAKGSGAPRCNANALKHGETTAELKSFRFEIKAAIQQSKKIINELG